MNGFIVVDKPAGLTSMQVVAAVRRRAGGVRTGHSGTLDPLATGVLVIGIGRATKSLGVFLALDKRYRATFDLSAFTTTDDLEGRRREVAVDAPPSVERVQACVRQMTGNILQRPPSFSAAKVHGRRAYKLSREGDPPELAPRPVDVYAIDILRYEWPELDLAIHCGKGTYIRSMARDLGAALGTGGHCAALRRVAVGPFGESMATPLASIPAPLTNDHLIPVELATAMIAHAPGAPPRSA
jgi:tRNA pseudouridine55 synthase